MRSHHTGIFPHMPPSMPCQGHLPVGDMMTETESLNKTGEEVSWSRLRQQCLELAARCHTYLTLHHMPTLWFLCRRTTALVASRLLGVRRWRAPIIRKTTSITLVLERGSNQSRRPHSQPALPHPWLTRVEKV